MYRKLLKVRYSYEHGSKKLSPIKELVSATSDPEKELILLYLKTNCIALCPGIFYDEIQPGNVIGCGHLFSDGTYLWDDIFTNYVEQYNIPVPKDFRDHILQNHSQRMARHSLLEQIDRIEIENNPYLGYRFCCRIHQNGMVEYSNCSKLKCVAIAFIRAEDTEHIIRQIMCQLFCCDSDVHGEPTIDGYHWGISFFQGDKLIDTVEGWNGENAWRHDEMKSIIEFLERKLPFDLGFDLMN